MASQVIYFPNPIKATYVCNEAFLENGSCTIPIKLSPNQLVFLSRQTSSNDPGFLYYTINVESFEIKSSNPKDTCIVNYYIVYKDGSD